MSSNRKSSSFVLEEFSANIRRLITTLLVSSVVILIASIYVDRVLGFGLFIIWNLFLAGLSLATTYLIHRSSRAIIKWVLGIFWLLVFPNAPYLITDLIHINTFRYYRAGVGYITDSFRWFVLVTLFFAIIVGVLFGCCSLMYMKGLVKKHLGNPLSWMFVGMVSILSGMAIYVGRFMRFNSWDVFTKPIQLILEVIQVINLNTIILCILFGTMTFLCYSFFHIMCYNKD